MVVSVFGGLGGIKGSILGGLIIGIIIALLQVLGYGDIALAVVYALVFIVFMVRPMGLIPVQKA